MKRYGRISTRSSRSALFIFFLGISLFFPLAAQDADSILKLDPASLGEGKRIEKAREAVMIAQQAIDRGEKFGQALDLLMKAKELDPDNAQAEFEIGRLYDDWRVGLRQQALEHYRAYLLMRPKDSRGLTHVANLLSNAGRLEEAEKNYLLAIEDPKANWSWMEYARYLVDNTDRNEEAVQAATKSLNIMRVEDRDNDPWPYRHRGIALFRLGQKDKARSDLEKARSIFQRYNDTWQVNQINAILAKF
jgi:tetratricopeptide (TPR) repeat protein